MKFFIFPSKFFIRYSIFNPSALSGRDESRPYTASCSPRFALCALHHFQHSGESSSPSVIPRLARPGATWPFIKTNISFYRHWTSNIIIFEARSGPGTGESSSPSVIPRLDRGIQYFDRIYRINRIFFAFPDERQK